MIYRRHFGVLLHWLVLLTILDTGATQVLKFVSVFPLTEGTQNDGIFAQSGSKSLELAVANLSATLPTGVEISLQNLDSKALGDVAVAVATQAVADGAIGVIGEVHSSTSMTLALALTDTQTIQCSGASTSIALSQKSARYFFSEYSYRTIPSDDHQGTVISKVITNTFDWTTIGLIHGNSGYAAGIADQVVTLTMDTRVEVIFNEQYDITVAGSFEAVLTALKATDARIIVWSGDPEDMLIFIPYARKLGLYGPSYSWICSETALSVPATVIANIANGTMEEADLDFLNGMIITSPMEGSGAAYANLQAEYSRAYNETLQQYAGFAYDCVVVMVRMLEYVHASGVSWTDIAAGNFPRDVGPFLNATSSEGIDGVTGSLRFDDNFNRNGMFNIFNVYDGQLRIIGKTTNDSLVVELDPSVPPLFYSGTSQIPSGKIALTRSWLKYSDPLAIVLLSLYATMMLITAMSVRLVYLWRQRSSIKALSPVHMTFICLGLEVAFTSVFTHMGEETMVKCNVRTVLYGISFAIVIAGLIAKTYRVWRVFSYEKLTTPLTVGVIVRLAGLFSLGEASLLALWAISPMTPSLVEYEDAGTFDYLCGSDTDDVVFAALIFAYNGILLLLATFLAMETRQAPSKYNESKAIAYTCYSLLFWCTLIMAVSYTGGTRAGTIRLVQIFGVLFVTSTTWVLLIGRIMYREFLKARWRSAGQSKQLLETKPGRSSGMALARAISAQLFDAVEVGEFPIRVVSSWWGRWERYEVILFTVPARLSLRLLDPTRSSGLVVILDEHVRAIRSKIHNLSFELSFDGTVMLVQTQSDKETDSWVRKLTEAAKKPATDSEGGGSVLGAARGVFANTGPLPDEVP
ncbi:hypothetical protein HKX48_001935 [Thoreauomyces humboldtii]|nr:hypothetical protein HKX48_001935 [Thoreauomyces humboldtii]